MATEHWSARHSKPIIFLILTCIGVGIYLAFSIPIAVFPSTDFPRIIVGVDNGVAPIICYRSLGSDLLPTMDEGGFILDYLMPAGSSLEETNRVLSQIEVMLRNTPEVESTSRRTGMQLGLAAGSQMLQPLAIAVIGGIAASMVLSLIVTPAVNYYITRR